jgi:hypothetical protein
MSSFLYGVRTHTSLADPSHYLNLDRTYPFLEKVVCEAIDTYAYNNIIKKYGIIYVQLI